MQSKHVFLYLLLLPLLTPYLVVPSATAQGTVLLEKTWGGENSDAGRDVAVDLAGNIYVTGTTYTFGVNPPDIFVLKYDKTGNLQWQRTWGGAKDDLGLGVTVDSSGNIYLTGTTESFGQGITDVCLLKFNPSGSLVWQKTWGGAMGDEGEDVAVDPSGNIYLTGNTLSLDNDGREAFLLKFDSSGNIVWQKSWGGRNDDIGRDIALDSSGNIYLTGTTLSNVASTPDMFLLKFDSSGGLIWQKTWGGGGMDFGWGVATTPTSDLYVTGYTTSYAAGAGDAYLLKFDSNGNLLWQRTWGGSQDDEGWDIAADPSGHILIVGFTDSFGAGSRDILLLQFDTTGSLLWQKAWGASKREWGYGAFLDSQGNAYATGHAAEAPPYILTSLTESLGHPTFTLATPKYSTTTPHFTLGSPNGTVNTPPGSETYGGGVDAILLKCGSLTPPTTTTTTTTIVTSTTTSTTTTTMPSTTTTTQPPPTPTFGTIEFTLLLTILVLTASIASRRKTKTTH